MKSTTYLELGTGEILQGEPVDDDSEEFHFSNLKEQGLQLAPCNYKTATRL